MTLVGLVRVSTDKQETQRQRDALDPICVKVFEEKVSGTLSVDQRPGLQAALDYLRPDDLLTVQEVDRLGRNLLEGLLVLTDLFERGIGVKVLDGIAVGEHTERSLVLDLALALAEDRRRDIVRKTRNGLEAARKRGKVGGRPTVVDGDKRAAILARRDRDESIREIAAGVGVSVGTVHRVLAGHVTDAQINAARAKLIIDKKLQRTSKPHIEKLAELKTASEHRPVAS
ncbi:recombinase family protein [Rhodococcus sp. 008]|uniref:recombinase family protein n=1 Tax=Rhodococcus sp. 008 TaxID=1723645 RepID=UPI0009F56BBF|nr:recombinase family protein [Rhodococcus sp. 008]